ncbi:hypothetical protein SS1G_10392 [Sclerotinia sclerotiorum 1980 UF-70]|uniref:Involucrin repeat protein n=1 Tax=Sclerotinia sclerotiorum (strain ATCC 18683 / 1980 / Ss-1) TaxID=665079 RepID=A7EYH6_SCLS1|nr:hypothetical protein SS1G_10392 [Sclerotinia sclerotiorum 1980 UF-70]EDN94518.1 hypothetical protein SS1G_10392 [Sclerotinia sclerotiorum 1980 UF-70]
MSSRDRESREKKHLPKSTSTRIDLSNPLAHRAAPTSGYTSTSMMAEDYDFSTSNYIPNTSQSHPQFQSQSQSSSEISAPPRVRLSHPHSHIKSTNHSTAESSRSSSPISSNLHPRSRSRSPSQSQSQSQSQTPSPPIPPQHPNPTTHEPQEFPPLSHPSSPSPSTQISTPPSQLKTLTTTLHHTRETLYSLQTIHSTLQNNYLTLDTQHRHLRSTHANCPSNSEVQSRIAALMLDRDAFREAYNEAMGEMRGKDEEIMELRGQVRGLKEWVSSCGRGGVGGEQVTDEVVKERMQWIGNALQNWVIMNFRRGRIDKAPDEVRQQLEQWVPMYQHLATSSKINFIQSLVSSLLVYDIFQAYFIGLPKQQAVELAQTERTLSSYGSEDAMNQWRSTTLGILLKEAPEKLKSDTATIVNTFVAQLNSLLDPICDVPSSEARDQSLKTIIHSAIDLSRLLRVQKAVFSIMMPVIEGHQRLMFDEERMEDIGGEDEDTLNEREISCVTFPGIVKAGDENGERSYLVNIVAKMKVLCAPD